MDHVNKAIAEARAARRAAAPEAPAPQAPVSLLRKAGIARPAPPAAPKAEAAPRPASSAVTRDAAWAALPDFRPDPELLEHHRVLTQHSRHEGAPFDVMRTKLLKQMRDRGWTRLAITSPTPSCGKSTVSANLAFSFSRQTETRAILCEMDFRRPSMARLLGMKRRQSISRVLKERAAFEEHAVRYGDNLLIATNAGPVRNPAELMHSTSAVSALRRIEETYAPDVMIFDMPPMLVADDTIAFAPHVDAVLLIAAAEATTAREIDLCEKDLADRTNVMGVILNKCSHPGQDYGYGYGYGYEPSAA
ncbi:CpsD/CapB family tyrosine-protein kinase [Jannaschia sp. Os4]|uniref:CpsD/CapB family tyrosine-protein kinase n=1 Tax=Jannaschia sp. Os4 TaxID=2807617 RepID=UPI001939BCEC|nr:CpsD/CapB family tyrosine-protein kinase [Jannaschia sp. Os4]MBM2575143.1 CpsD/CapB family tyrosine-protein kinase [Jannaschia sp. Os4]